MTSDVRTEEDLQSLSKRMAEKSLPLPRILLVDDDLMFGKILTKVAQRERIPLTFCSSVKDVGRMGNSNFDVGIFDYDLGSITGLQLSEFLERYLERIPVVLVSQYRHLEKKKWPKCVKHFVHKSVGSYGILAAACELYEGVAPQTQH
jgi:CheY-like chemotaxis protein